jgi:hypothetical protein
LADSVPAWFEQLATDRLRYDATSGQILFKVDCGRAKAGIVADKRMPNGYLTVRIQKDGVRVTVCSHRMAWFLVTGAWPAEELDHINKVRHDNRMENLRECNRSLNVVRTLREARTLPRGVTWAGHTNKTNPYLAQIGNTYIGYFGTPEAAHAAYLAAFENRYGSEWKEF